MQETRYIAIEGPIGVGKTSLSKLLTNAFDAKLILEDASGNPFLENFYKDKKGYAFQAQIFFLLNRYKQQTELLQMDLFNKCIITDYLFAKDRIFANINLGDYELKLYNDIYSLLEVKLVKPDLVIYLKANTDIILNRIGYRNRGFERTISKEYIEKLNTAFNDFFFHYEEAPLLIIDTTKIDYVNQKVHLDDLIKKISTVKKGKEYYMPLGSK